MCTSIWSGVAQRHVLFGLYSDTRAHGPGAHALHQVGAGYLPLFTDSVACAHSSYAFQFTKMKIDTPSLPSTLRLYREVVETNLTLGTFEDTIAIIKSIQTRQLHSETTCPLKSSLLGQRIIVQHTN